MQEYINAFDNLPLVVKIIFALPMLDILWAIYRLCKSLSKQNTVGIVLAVLMLIVCPALFWLVDIITLAFTGKVLWIDWFGLKNLNKFFKLKERKNKSVKKKNTLILRCFLFFCSFETLKTKIWFFLQHILKLHQ